MRYPVDNEYKDNVVWQAVPYVVFGTLAVAWILVAVGV